MDSFITLTTFTYPSEAYVLRGKLESEGIECFIKDELTVQANPLYSNAIGGVKLQVKESDVQQAKEILKEGGYAFEDESAPSELLVKIADKTSKIPFLKELPDLIRVLIIFAIVTFVIFIAVVLLLDSLNV